MNTVNVVVAGANGFIGSALVQNLLERGWGVTALVRNPGDMNVGDLKPYPGGRTIKLVGWSAEYAGARREAFAAANAVINLAGASVGGKRWTPEYKKVLRDSRIETTRAIVEAMRQTGRADQVLVNSSAVGYYGDCGDRIVTEQDLPGTGFMAELCREWEAEARRAEEFGARVVLLRSGIVLGKGGALAQMLPPFRFGVGGPLGSGRQWMSWIRLEDAVSMIAWAIETPEVRGPLNVTSPNPVANRDFAAAVGKALHRPAFLPAPAFALRVLLGEFADALLTGQRVIPAVAQQHVFGWQFPNLESALRDIV